MRSYIKKLKLVAGSDRGQNAHNLVPRAHIFCYGALVICDRVSRAVQLKFELADQMVASPSQHVPRVCHGRLENS